MNALKKKRKQDKRARPHNDALAERLSRLSERDLLAWADDVWAHASVEELNELVKRSLRTKDDGHH